MNWWIYATTHIVIISGLGPSLLHKPTPKPVDPFTDSPMVANQVVYGSEPFVRAQKSTELMDSAIELFKAGLHAQAQQLYQQAQQVEQQTLANTDAPKANPDEVMRSLVVKLLRQSEFAVADQVLRAWNNQPSEDPRIQILQAFSYFGQGQLELSLRELRGLEGSIPKEFQGMVELLSLLLQMQLTGVVPGVENNPWNVQFVNESGSFEPGKIAEAQRVKLPENVTDNMARIVSLLPTQANLWGLYGELLNATGDPLSAKSALVLAKTLLYYPRPLRDHLRILEEHEKAVADQIQKQMADASAAKPAPATGAEVPPPQTEVQQLAPRSQIVIVVVVGVSLVVLLAILQIREWSRARSKTKPKESK